MGDFLTTGLADRIDIFALGATTYELLRGVELPRSGQEYLDVRAGRLVLPGVDTRLLTLLKVRPAGRTLGCGRFRVRRAVWTCGRLCRRCGYRGRQTY
jgi:hypothetical protein